MKKVLLLADQPFQLELMASVANSLRENKIMVSIFVTDLFTFVYGPHLIERIFQDLHIEVMSLEREFRTWQIRGEPDASRLSIARTQLDRFSLVTSRGRKLETLRLTDPYTNGFEFESWYLPISEEWKDVAHSDIISRCQMTLEQFQPDLIASIDNCQLSTNVFHALAQESCTFITFQNSRIGTRWVPRFDLAIGNYQDSKLKMPKSISKDLAAGETESYLKQLRNSKKVLYRSPAIEFGSRLNENGISKKEYYRNALSEIKDILIHTPRSIILGPRSRNFKVRRFDQNFFRINIFEAKRRLVNLFPDKIVSPKDFESVGYFFWTLHYRPEGSGLVLGYGQDEFVYLKEVARLLDSTGMFLVVKENPLMFGTRSKKDLRMLSELKNVFFAPRFSNPMDWIAESKGVIGVSGTSLLEAAILGIPSYALGVPEFLPAVWSKDDISLNEFLANCIDGSITCKEEKLYDYLQFVLENSSDDDVLLSPGSNKSQLMRSVERMSDIIQKSLFDF